MIDSLAKMIEDGFGITEKYNCAEKIVRGANIAYGLELPDAALRMMSGFGGGMGGGEVCGTISGAVAVLSYLLVRDQAHTATELKPATQRFIKEFREQLGVTQCIELRPKYRTKEHGCDYIITTAASILDGIVQEIA